MVFKSKKHMAAFAGGLILSAGVGVFVGSAIRQIPTAHLSRSQKLLFNVGSLGVSLAVGHIVEREVKAVIREAVTGYNRTMEEE